MNEILGAIVGGIFTIYAVRYSFNLENKRKRAESSMGFTAATPTSLQKNQPSKFSSFLKGAFLFFFYYITLSFCMGLDSENNGGLTFICLLLWIIYLGLNIIKNHSYYRKMTVVLYLLLFAFSIFALVIELN